MRDVQTALRAEIRHYADALALFDLEESWALVVGQMEEDASYMPTIPSEVNDTVFRAIVGEVHVLPGPVIEPVVRYYNQVFAIEAMIADMRGGMMAGMTRTGQIAAYTDYIALKIEALKQGRQAISAINQALGDADTIASTASAAVNSPDAARSDPQSGGGI